MDQTPKRTDHAKPPIACSLRENELVDRRREVEDLARAALLHRARLPGGVRLTYRRSEPVEAAVRNLIERERRCCPFLDFVLSVESGALIVDISGPREAEGVLDAIHDGILPELK